MITEFLDSLKIHKLSKKQYKREEDAGNLDPTAMYLTPLDVSTVEVSKSEGVTRLTFTDTDENEESVEILDGYTPVKGVDYFTPTDIEQTAKEVLKVVPLPTYADLSNLENGSWTETIDGKEISHTSILDEDYTQITIDGVTIKLR